MPTFCRHNRFIERCPICSKTLPERTPSPASSSRAKRGASGARSAAHPGRPRHARADGLRVRREGRAEDDGYRSALAPGLRAFADANRLAQELAFASGRLLGLAAAPPGLYAHAHALHDAGDGEQATWTCFLIAYLGPLEDDEPFAGIEQALALVPWAPEDGAQWPATSTDALGHVPLGPRTSHEQARGLETLRAYAQWVRRSGGADASKDAESAAGEQARAFDGDPTWNPQRRFERLFERLALPGLSRAARYELLVTLGRLGLYELRPDALHLGGARGIAVEDPTTLAAKRVFGIGDPLLLERRASALAEAVSVPIEALDLALYNWQAPVRAGQGFPADTLDGDAYERAGDALGL